MIHFIMAIFAIPLIFFVTGFFTFTPKSRKNKENALSLFEISFIQVIISVLISSVSGFILALTGRFSLLNLILTLSVYSLSMLIVRRQNPLRALPKPRPDSITILMALIIILAGFFYIKPFEYVVGGWDPGVYVNTGAVIARTGSLVIQDDFIKSMSPEDQKVFAHIRHELVQKYPGFPIVEAGEGKIIPYFFHLYPVWIAIFFSLFGVKFSLYVNAVFGILALMAIYHAGRSIFNVRVGVIAAFLLSINIAQVWQARFPTTEILTQFLIFSSFYLLTLDIKNNGYGYSVLSAICLGMAFFVRIDSALLIPPVVLFLFYRFSKGHSNSDLAFAITFGLMLITAVVYYYVIAWLPAGVVLGAFRILSRNLLVAGALASIIIISLARVIEHKYGILEALLTLRNFRIAIMLFITSLAFYAYFIRPEISNSKDAGNMFELGWFVSPAGLLLGLTGLLMVTYCGLDDKKALLYLAAMTVSSFFLYRKMIHPVYMWAVRRYVPVVIPSFIVFASYAIYRISESIGKKTGIVFTFLLIALVGGHTFIRGSHLFYHTDYIGTVDFVEHLSEKFSKEDILVFDDYRFSTPLACIYGLNTLTVSDHHKENAPEKCVRASELMAEWIAQGKNVYYLTYTDTVFSHAVDNVINEKAGFNSALLTHKRRGIPTEIKRVSPEINIFRILELGSSIVNEGEYKIDIGLNAFGLLYGFYELQKHQRPDNTGITFRWTTRRARIRIPALESLNGGKVALRVKSQRPYGAPQARLKVSINGKEISNSIIKDTEDFQTLILDVPPGLLNRNSILQMECETWNPKKTGLSGDNRDLGLMLDWVKITGTGLSEVIDPPFLLDVGKNDEAIIDGFWSVESLNYISEDVRWTSGSAAVVIPWFGDDIDTEIIVSASGQRPGGVPLAEVRISIDGKEAGIFTASNEFKQYRFVIPAGSTSTSIPGRAVLKFDSTIWIPSMHHQLHDNRELGIMLDWVKLKNIDDRSSGSNGDQE